MAMQRSPWPLWSFAVSLSPCANKLEDRKIGYLSANTTSNVTVSRPQALSEVETPLVDPKSTVGDQAARSWWSWWRSWLQHGCCSRRRRRWW
jgi:hypothetical protein